MRYVILLKGDPPADTWPEPASTAAMAAFEADLDRAGVLLAAERLRPSWTAVHLGPVDARPGTGAAVAGLYVIDVRSRDEAIAWARRCPIDPALHGGIADVEVRPVADGAPW